MYIWLCEALDHITKQVTTYYVGLHSQLDYMTSMSYNQNGRDIYNIGANSWDQAGYHPDRPLHRLPTQIVLNKSWRVLSKRDLAQQCP